MAWHPGSSGRRGCWARDPLIRAGSLELAGDNTYDLPHIPTWWHDRTVLVGDAVHAPSPSSGQGTAMALEDAVVLARALRGSTENALADYEHSRRARVEKIVKAGARTSSTKIPDRSPATYKTPCCASSSAMPSPNDLQPGSPATACPLSGTHCSQARRARPDNRSSVSRSRFSGPPWPGRPNRPGVPKPPGTSGRHRPEPPLTERDALIGALALAAALLVAWARPIRWASRSAR